MDRSTASPTAPPPSGAEQPGVMGPVEADPLQPTEIPAILSSSRTEELVEDQMDLEFADEEEFAESTL